MPSPVFKRLAHWFCFNFSQLKHSFKCRIVLAFVGLLVTFIWALAFFSVTILQNQFNKVLADQQFAATERVAAELDNKLRLRLDSLEKMATHFSRGLDPAAASAALQQFKALHTLFPTRVALLGLDGSIIAEHAAGAAQGASGIGASEQVRRSVARGKPYIDKAYIDPGLRQPVLAIAVPVFDGGGRVHAALLGVVDLDTLVFLSSEAAPAQGSAELFVIAPRDQLIVAASDSALVMSKPPARGVNLMYDRFLDGYEGTGVATSAAGMSKLFSGKRVPVSGWLVSTALPTAVAFGPVNAMQSYLYVIAALMTVAGIAIIQWTTRRILTPLEHASTTMRAMKDGKTAFAALPLEGDDEIAGLVSSFNQLVGERQRYEQALRDSEQRFRMLAESAPDAIFVQAGAGFSYANAAALRLLGAPGTDQLPELPPGGPEAPSGALVITKMRRLDGAELDVEMRSVPFDHNNATLVFARDISERMRLDAILRASEARYRSLFTHMLAGFAHCRMLYKNGKAVDFAFLDVNPAFETFTGLKDVTGKRVSEVVPAIHESNPGLLAIFARVAQGGPAERFEEYIPQMERCFDLAAYCPAPGTFMVVFNDITEKFRAEQCRREQAEEVRTLVENSPDLILRFDAAARCVYVNAAFEAATGLRRETMLGQAQGGEGFRALGAAQWLASVEQVLRTAQPDTFDFALTLTGCERYFQIRLVPEFDADGNVATVVAVARDISVLKSGEAVLRESEQRIHGIAANTPGMVFQCRLARPPDGPLAFTYVSEGCQLLFGLSPLQILASSEVLLAGLVEPDRARFRTSLRYSAESMTAWNWEGRTLASEGGETWINCRATPRNCSDASVMWEGVMFNISESKRSEQDLRQSRQLLRALSAHMDSVREEERKRIAREVHDELGQALTVLRMDLSLLRLNFGSHNAQLLERIHAMKAGLDRTIGIMRHVTSTLRPVALDLGLLAGLEWLVEEFNGRGGITCRLSKLGCEDVVLDDSRATALFRIVQESLTNVLKHAQASEVEVLIKLAPGELICLQISDNGKGFLPIEARPAGSFGLIGVRERALMLRGTVDIRSAPRQGTLIEVCIPLEAPTAGDEAAPN